MQFDWTIATIPIEKLNRKKKIGETNGKLDYADIQFRSYIILIDYVFITLLHEYRL